ncbi:hypothetical protein ABIC28_002992 [Rhodococcus sp. PvR044]|uniref:hypothetical protein n=1 Tax=Rhodococcus sp. PvR044 TaxID=3156402 RepID=UPI003397FA13
MEEALWGYIPEQLEPRRFRIRRANDEVIEAMAIGRWDRLETRRGPRRLEGLILRLPDGKEIALIELLRSWGDEPVEFLDAGPWLEH